MSAAVALKYLTVNALTKHTATVVFVHGLGDSGHGWEPVAQMFSKDPELNHVKWILPHAPLQPVTANSGMVMPSWFDIMSFDFDSEEDEEGMRKSSLRLNELITAEIDAGIDASKIVLGGFSQGGAMSLFTGLGSERKLAGLAVLSGFLPLHHKFKDMLSDHARLIPIFWGHGTADPLVGYDLCKKSVSFLKNECGIKELGDKDKDIVGIRCMAYQGMQHSSCIKELDDLRSWLKSVIPKEDGRRSTDLM